MNKITAAEFYTISQAVVSWYRFYGVRPVAGRSAALCREALILFDDGLTTAEEIATTLIEKYRADESHSLCPSAATKH